MIISCGECATQFQLDEARVPASGIRVRCSVCKHAFFVGHPDALEDDLTGSVERAVSEVLEGEPDGIPEATADLETPDASAGSADDGVEERWEFNDGGRLSEAASPDPVDRFEESFEAAREAVDDLLGSPWQAPPPASSRVEADAEDAPPFETAPPAGAELPALDDTEPGPVPPDDDLWQGAAWSDPDPAFESAGPEEIASPAESPVGSDAAFALDPELHEADEIPALEGDPLEADELDVGDGEDPFANEALGEALEAFETAEEGDLDPLEEEEEVSHPDQASDLATPEDWGLDGPTDGDGPAQEGLRALAVPEASATAPMPIGFGPLLELEPRRGSVLAWLARTGSGLGWGAVSILAAVALWGSVAPRSTPVHAPGSQALAGLEATGVEGRWVENATLGALYVVSGELHNPGSETKIPGARLVVRLLDAQGAPVAAAPASLAPPRAALLLREGRAEDLHASSEAGALALARMPVAPGAKVAFEAVVLNLPDAAQRFDLAQAR